MTRFVALLLVLLSVAPVAAQGPGLFVRTDCTTITGAVTGQTWCFDATARALKVWNGSAYDSAPVPPAAVATVVGSYAIRNLVGQNDATTPNTKYGLSADLIQLRNPTTGAVTVRTSVTTITCDLGVVGVNGLDTGTQAASTWYYFYAIDNGTAAVCEASLTAPPTGPSLPTGYVSWAYAGAVYSNSSTFLVKTRMRGATMYYEVFQNALNAGNATSETAVSLTTLVPPNTLTAQFIGRSFVVAGSQPTDTIRFRYVTAQDFMQFGQSGGTANQPDSGSFEMPVLSQSVFYISVTTGTALTGSLDVQAYRVPNGGD